MMFRDLKLKITKLIPIKLQVPIKYWYCLARGYIEPEMALLTRIISPSSRAIDVGGNRGIYTYFISKLCSKIEVFEPNSSCFEVLYAWSSSKNGINIHKSALSNEAGVSKLFIPVDDNGVEHDSSGSIEESNSLTTTFETVPLQRLDEFSFENVDFIKIDVEGHELSVIEGAKKTLIECNPALLIEIEQRHNKQPIEEIFIFIKSFGYSGFFLKNGFLMDISSFNKFSLQKEENLNTNDLYVNNFLFLSNERLKKGNYKGLAHIIKK
jgi:FkbM family methyltransferase